jgi:hypothetical protein
LIYQVYLFLIKYNLPDDPHEPDQPLSPVSRVLLGYIERCSAVFPDMQAIEVPWGHYSFPADSEATPSNRLPPRLSLFTQIP